jgi:hypothetical protein
MYLQIFFLASCLGKGIAIVSKAEDNTKPASDIKIEMTIKTKRASRSVPAEPSDGKRLLIVLKPSSAWRQGIPYDKPHVPELAPDDTLFDINTKKT